MATERARYFAKTAWVNGAWAADVLLVAGTDGRWARVRPDCAPAERAGAQALTGPVLPGLVNAHSHAFQRAMAGLGERAMSGEDDFWSWRERMYQVANRITPDQLEAIATFLYGELLQGGYTHVCEFHYLHRDLDGRPYAEAREMSLALVRAAHRAGIGLTLLPTVYMRSGFAARSLREEQRRFESDAQWVLGIATELSHDGAADGVVTAGVALHSLRAAHENALREVAAGAGAAMPIHIHVAEQRRELEDCIAQHGRTPAEWLLSQVAVDARWNLVHATHCSPAELERLRDHRVSIVLCPSTEANLGDGIFDLPAWLGQSGNWSIGSDSHVTRGWQEELRLLEYSQRLRLRQRNVAARAALSDSGAAALFQGALEGGTAAAGLPLGGLAPGQRADFLVVDDGASALQGIPASHLLDTLVFSSPPARFSDVFVAGRPVLAGAAQPGAAQGMRRAMQALWG